MSHGEHERYNRRLFEDFDRRVLGSESAQEAQVRFARALLKEMSETKVGNLVAVTHGTVIALFVCDYNREIASFGLWRRLDCCSFVVLGIPAMEVLHIGDGADPRRPGHAGLRETSRNG
jgi:broad specificity phosphatase PhoE